ncbi:uncharacterized protein LOC141588598 [Silene latifolia]|uniref:uncharacterized protein LOC141588598 n=1 Tax=Silene latifolia TaxID=37657 RepID=UPI003D789109
MAIGDCTRLVEKVVARIRGWGARKLSYTGRLVLVQSVLSQLHVYWSRIFVIPATVIDRITTICRNFLWSASISMANSPYHGSLFVFAKKHGGLGVVNSRKWNLAMIGKYTWWLACKSDHLWIKWVNHIYMKGVDWKHYEPSQNTSWTWRMICKVKNIRKFGYVHNNWATANGVYTINAGYQWLQGSMAKVEWYPLVWNRFNLPKHSFIVRLCARQRLLTKDKAWAFGVVNDGICEICKLEDETHMHLFYQCPFSVSSWQLLKDGFMFLFLGRISFLVYSVEVQIFIKKTHCVCCSACCFLLYMAVRELVSS